MHSFITLLRREWLEGRNAYVISPAVVLALVVLAGLFASAVNPTIELDGDDLERLENAEGTTLDGVAAITAMALDVPGSTDAELVDKISGLSIGIAQPFYITLMIVTFFALIACIHDERKDRSVLFWKSMPVSDLHTVLSKYVTIAWIAPLATILGIWLAQLFALTYLSLYTEDGFGGRVWTASHAISTPFHLMLGYAIHGLWAMPVYAWVMLVSARADKAPILWALGGPVVVILLERIFFGTSVLFDAVGHHMRLIALPSISSDGYPSFGAQLGTLLEPSMWVGLIVGGALLAATVYCRRRYNEI